MARRVARKTAAKPPGPPTRAEILRFIETSDAPVGKREIARAFAVKGQDRLDLKSTLRELEREGLLARGRGRRLAEPSALPEVAVVDIVGTDADGEVIGRPAAWRGEQPAPKVYLAPERAGDPALAAGAKVLARLRRLSADSYEGRAIRVLAAGPLRILGVYEMDEHGRGSIRPADKRDRKALSVAPGDSGGAAPGDVVLAESRPGRHPGLRSARVVERIGPISDPHTFSLVSIHTFGIPHVFPAAATRLAESAGEPDLAGRDDLRAIPLVTIDGADARDFDDAVWAEPDPDPQNEGGWHILVAIADVAWYVRPGDALDREAYERGNSVYFPDRVVPMLPEPLSNGLCSLRPGEARGCLAAHLWIDARGEIRRHRFVRGLMRSAARLTYEQVQAARDGRPDDATGPLLQPVIAPLYGAFAALLAARRRRGTLEIELTERRVLIGDDGRVRAVVPRVRLDSHRLIEEYMIAANVAAAEALEAAGQPCMYRIHDKPDAAKVEALRAYLSDLGIGVTAGELNRPKQFTRLLERVAGGPVEQVVNELVLRTQSQAVYSPTNIGHFGLALRRYAHFTSPIRRYSDLLVHRALVSAVGLGAGGLPSAADAAFAETGEHLSATERRAAAAERDALDRFTAAYLESEIGAIFGGRITGVTRFGLFVRLDEVGADGLVPVATLPADYYDHDERRHTLVGRRTGRGFRLGEAVSVRLVSADPATGGVILQIVDAPAAHRPPRGPFRRVR